MDIRVLFQKEELITVVAQHHETKQVLMVGSANEEAVRLIFETKTAWFWSRTRGALWQKGETSGNTLHVVEAYTDCYQSKLLLLCRPDGPTCHTGAVSCFYTKVL